MQVRMREEVSVVAEILQVVPLEGSRGWHPLRA